MGLRNILAITGDPPKLGDYPEATAVYDLDSIGMTKLLKNLNCGRDLGAKRFSPALEMTIGVGVNPAATDIQREMERFKAKVQAGAEYAVTQPVFDIYCLRKFCDAANVFGIPIIAGIWPFISYKNAEFMANEVPGITVPIAILERMSRASTKSDGIKIGIEIAQEMIDGVNDCVGGFAVSAPFGNVSIALAAIGKGTPNL
jgi:homocysteine S-methyltransferase